MAVTELISLGAAVAWGGVWVNFVVILFFTKGEKLHQDYKEKGSLDAAVAAIESNRLIPALARIFERARDARENKRTKIDMEELLQAVDFLPDLEQLQAALQEKRSLEDAYKALHNLANSLWRWGLLHVLATVALPLLWLGNLPDATWIDVARILVSLLWVATLVWMIAQLFRFHRRMNAFLGCLGPSREETR